MTDNQNIAPEPGQIIEQVPAFAGIAGIRLAPLQGVQSLNNTILAVSLPHSAERFVLRIANPIAQCYLGVRRPEEMACARGAAAAGVGPEVLYYDAEHGHMVTPWIEAGASWTAADFVDPGRMQRLAELLRRLHAVPLATEDGAVFRRIERLLESVVKLRLDTPPGIDAHRRRLIDIEAAWSSEGASQTLNHNDLWANNLLDDGKRLWLVDWEFSGRGHGHFDLATISMAGAFDAALETRLLGAYGLDGAAAMQDLQSAKWVVRLFEATWSLVMDHLSADKHDAMGQRFDFRAHAGRMFEGLSD